MDLPPNSDPTAYAIAAIEHAKELEEAYADKTRHGVSYPWLMERLAKARRPKEYVEPPTSIGIYYLLMGDPVAVTQDPKSGRFVCGGSDVNNYTWAPDPADPTQARRVPRMPRVSETPCP
jgi:hypothetical protein